MLEHEGLLSGSLAIGLSKMSDGSCSDATGEMPHNFLMDITEACSGSSKDIHITRPFGANLNVVLAR